MSLDERFDVVDSLKCGQKFIYNDETYMKLPDHVECYGNKVNAINIKTGTLLYFSSSMYIDLITMTIEKESVKYEHK